MRFVGRVQPLLNVVLGIFKGDCARRMRNHSARIRGKKWLLGMRGVNAGRECRGKEDIQGLQDGFC